MKGEAHGSYSNITLSFHANSNCLKDWNYHNNIGKRMNTLAPFNNKVAILPHLYNKLQPSHQQQLIQLEAHGIHIVSQTSFNTTSQIDQSGM